jgi:tRNA-Thr(GGU) m(6)t(6)A37 methyltransferase TsaA
MEEVNYQLNSIGEVNRTEKGYVIQLSDQVKEALLGLKDFSHVQIYWWAHRLDSEEMRNIHKVEKPYKKGPQKLGIFATRSPMRPNPLAMTVVPVTFIDEEHGLLGIAFIDAEPGTPVLDIKPYYGMERVKEYHVPSWCSHWPRWYEDAADFDWAGEFENAR